MAALDDSDHVRRSLGANRQGLEYLQGQLKNSAPRVPSHGNFVLVRVGKGQEVFKQLLSRGVIVPAPWAVTNFPSIR